MTPLIPIEQLNQIAKDAGYFALPYQANIGLASYTKAGVRINVYVSKMTVATCLDHPKKGKTQLFRRNVTLKQIPDLFANPRKHTGKGYYKKD